MIVTGKYLGYDGKLKCNCMGVAVHERQQMTNVCQTLWREVNSIFMAAYASVNNIYYYKVATRSLGP